MTGEVLLTPAEAAALMGISTDDLAALRADGQGPEWGQWKGTVRYDARAVRAWLTRNPT